MEPSKKLSVLRVMGLTLLVHGVGGLGWWMADRHPANLLGGLGFAQSRLSF